MPCANSDSIFLFQAKRSSIKLDIYRKFSNALAVTVIASVVWIGYEVHAHFNCFCVFGSFFPFLLFKVSILLYIRMFQRDNSS